MFASFSVPTKKSAYSLPVGIAIALQGFGFRLNQAGDSASLMASSSPGPASELAISVGIRLRNSGNITALGAAFIAKLPSAASTEVAMN